MQWHLNKNINNLWGRSTVVGVSSLAVMNIKLFMVKNIQGLDLMICIVKELSLYILFLCPFLDRSVAVWLEDRYMACTVSHFDQWADRHNRMQRPVDMSNTYIYLLHTIKICSEGTIGNTIMWKKDKHEMFWYRTTSIHSKPHSHGRCLCWPVYPCLLYPLGNFLWTQKPSSLSITMQVISPLLCFPGTLDEHVAKT